MVRLEMTLSVESSILIRRAAGDVFAYGSDYTLDPTWRTGLSEMRHDPPGQIHLGAKTHERLTFAGMRMINVAEIVEFEPGRKTAFKTIGGPLTASGYRVAPHSPAVGWPYSTHEPTLGSA